MSLSIKNQIGFATEIKLVELLKRGDNAAFKSIVETYADKIFNTTLNIIQNTQDAEDIVQEVFIEVYKSIHQFNEQSKLSTWIYRITINKCLYFKRKQSAKKRFAFIAAIFQGNFNFIQIEQKSFQHPSTNLENKDDAKALLTALNKIPTNQQIAFNLHKIEGLSYSEVATVMDISIPSVESLLFRAKQNLKALLKDYYNKRD